jgi:DNA-binding response OmpR family regulator
MCIVVVEDEADVQEVVRVVLEDEGYRVLAFAHPDPVTHLDETEEHPDLFLIDVMLPEMSGIELARRLTNAGFDATPKIAMSASREHVIEATRSRLFDDAIRKPFEIDHLLACVEHYVTA